MQATTPPPDANSVTHSGKLCGSPRFARFCTARSRRKQVGAIFRDIGQANGEFAMSALLPIVLQNSVAFSDEIDP